MISGRMWSSHPSEFVKLEIQNDRHENTEVIISSTIIEMDTLLFHQTICLIFMLLGLQ